MTNAMIFFLLLALAGVVLLASIAILLSACEEITCSFGPLDSGFKGVRGVRRMTGRRIDLQGRSTSFGQAFDEQMCAKISPTIPEFLRKDRSPASDITRL